MLRNRAVAFLLCCLASRLVFALGLGPLEATSALNEPFKGRIEVLGAKAEDFDTLTVALAGEDQFRRAGIDRVPALFNLRFSVADTTDGKDYISITSREPIREPFLNFLLEMNWGNGRLLREYTVLLDPPLYDPNRRQAAASPVSRAPAPVSSRAVMTPPMSASMPRAAAASAAPAARSASGEIGPVGAGDTLWSLASAYRPDDSVSIQQMMLAILRQNPDAFRDGNVNMLRRGAVLHVPDDAAIHSISARDAAAEIRHQHQLWQEYRQQVAAAPAAQPLGTPPRAAAPATAAAPAAVDGDAHLELVAPGGSAAGAARGKPGTAGAEGAAPGDAKLVRDEQLDSTKQQTGDLKDRLSEAEEIINILQRQVNIKDQELAALQARLAELGIKQGDLGAAAATEATTATGAQPATPSDAAVTPAPSDAVATQAAETPTAGAPATSEPEIDIDTGKTSGPAAATSEAVAPAGPEPEIEVEAPAASERGFPASLVPQAIADMIPGGALGVLGIAVLLLLAIGAAVARGLTKSSDDVAKPIAVPVRAAAATVGSEDVTQTGPTVAQFDDDRTAAPTVFDPLATTPSLPAFDPNATVEASAAEATVQQAAPESDPLEEVNVYLAYERFDQAEELVKRVIAQYPDRHEYKLRLLEVYYSSNDRMAYENAARGLHDAVGANHPLWASALAMWSEMSPDRALFAEGAGLDATLLPASAATAFVDITGDSDTHAGESTITQVPGSSTLDFDLVGEATDSGAEGVLDLTADGEGEVLDLTASADSADFGSVLDLTASEDDASFDIASSGVFDLTEGVGGNNELLDITGGDDGAKGEDLLDITGGGETSELSDNFLDLSGGGSDLLDVTKTGDVSMVDDLDLLNVTASGLNSAAPSDGASLDTSTLEAELDSTQEKPALAAAAFDISDTVAPAFKAAADVDGEADDDILDITGGALAAATDDLEFDIGGLDIEDHPTVEMELPAVARVSGLDLDLTAGSNDASDLDFDIAAGEDELAGAFDISESEGAEGDLEITMGSNQLFDGELSLKGAGLDAIALDGESDDELGELDFSLEGTTDMDSISAEDTLDMSNAISARNSLAGTSDDDVSLDDLTLELDTAIGSSASGNPDHLETLALDALDIESDDMPDLGASQTIVMPVDHTIERQSAADEADTKLNLAKAYIELGDNEGARSILDEVATDGTAAQQTEAKTLLSRLKA